MNYIVACMQPEVAGHLHKPVVDVNVTLTKTAEVGEHDKYSS